MSKLELENEPQSEDTLWSRKGRATVSANTLPGSWVSDFVILGSWMKSSTGRNSSSLNWGGWVGFVWILGAIYAWSSVIQYLSFGKMRFS